jgi:hypothetical protein
MDLDSLPVNTVTLVYVVSIEELRHSRTQGIIIPV